MQLGMDGGKDWTLAVDGDVIIKKNAVRDLLTLAKSLPDNFFRMEGTVLDKFFGFPRKGGAHLYRTQYFHTAYPILSTTQNTIRPESRMVKEMVKKGFHSYQGAEVYGIHDFFQYYKDIYRKTFVYASKFEGYIPYFENFWNAHKESDSDYRVALHGLQEGLKAPGAQLPPIEQLHNAYYHWAEEQKLEEKMAVEVEASPDHIISTFQTPEQGRLYREKALLINRSDKKKNNSLTHRLLRKIKSTIFK